MLNRGFTLVELMIYSAILIIVSTLLVSILSVVTRIAGTESSSSEIAHQGNFIIQTIQRLVRESSAVEVPNPTTLRIYSSSYTVAPITITLSGQNINLTDSSGASALNTSKILVNSLVFKKISNPGSLDVVGVDLTLSYNSTNPGQALTRTLSTAVSRANAATFDTGVFPSVANSLDVGAAGTRWANGYFNTGNFSGNLTVTGSAIVNNGLEVAANGYFQFDKTSAGAPVASDCTSNTQRGKMSIDTTNNRLYICNGTSRGWDFINLND